MTYRKGSLSNLILRICNVAIITIAILFVGLAVRRYRVNQLSKRTHIPASFKAGARFPVEGLDWTRSNQTLVVVLQQTCAICSESAPFYRLIEQHRSDPNETRLVALLQEDLSNTAYLQKLQLSFDEIKSVSLRDLKPYGLLGTPTLVLVNEKGVVTNIWPGKLTARQQSEVLRALQIRVETTALQQIAPAGPTPIDQAEIQRLRDAGQNLTVIDLRDREKYAQGHLEGAKNIPIDELSVRAINELGLTDLIVLDGGDDNLYATAVQILARDGFTIVRSLQASKPAALTP